jgi:hypothetical protein
MEEPVKEQRDKYCLVILWAEQWGTSLVCREFENDETVTLGDMFIVLLRELDALQRYEPSEWYYWNFTINIDVNNANEGYRDETRYFHRLRRHQYKTHHSFMLTDCLSRFSHRTPFSRIEVKAEKSRRRDASLIKNLLVYINEKRGAATDTPLWRKLALDQLARSTPSHKSIRMGHLDMNRERLICLCLQGWWKLFRVSCQALRFDMPPELVQFIVSLVVQLSDGHQVSGCIKHDEAKLLLQRIQSASRIFIEIDYAVGPRIRNCTGNTR